MIRVEFSQFQLRFFEGCLFKLNEDIKLVIFLLLITTLEMYYN